MTSGIGLIDILASEITMVIGVLVFLFCGALLGFNRSGSQKGLAAALIATGLYLTFVVWLVIMWG